MTSPGFSALQLFLLLHIMVGFFGCSKKVQIDPDSGGHPLLSLPTVAGISGSQTVYDSGSATFTITVPAGTSVKSLKIDVSIPEGASIDPDPSMARDYSNPVKYTISNNGTNQQFFISVVPASSSQSSDKRILTFRFAALDTEGEIDHTERKVIVRVPDTQDVTSLTPTIFYSNKASVSPASGVQQNFSAPVHYTVTAEDGSSQVYEVKVEKVEGTINKNVLYYVGYVQSVEGAFQTIYHTGYLVAVNADTGEEIWRCSLGKTEPYQSKPQGHTFPIVARVFDQIQVTYGNYIYIVSPIGTKLREFFHYEAAVQYGPFIHNNSVYYQAAIGFGEYQGKGLIKHTREINAGNYTTWKTEYLDGIGRGMATEGDVLFSLASSGLTYEQGSVKAYNMRSEQAKWEYKFEREDTRPANSRGVIAGDLLYLQFSGGRCIALDKHTGSLKYQLNYRNTSGPIEVKDDILFFFREVLVNGVETNFFCAYDMKAGRYLWEKRKNDPGYFGSAGIRSVRLWNDQLLVNSDILVDPATGEIISRSTQNFSNISTVHKNEVFGGSNLTGFNLHLYDLSSGTEKYARQLELKVDSESNLLYVSREGDVSDSRN